MVQETNATSSACVYVGVKDNQLQVIQGGDTPTVHDARVANNPVWVRLEKKEDRVDVFQSDDNINYTLLTTVTLALTSPFNVGMVVGATNTTGQATQGQFGEVVVQTPQDEARYGTASIPFEITSDFDGLSLASVTTIFTKTVVTNSSGYADVPLFRDGSIDKNIVYLIDDHDVVLAMDVLRPMMRRSVAFSHENTARASVMNAHPLLLPNRQRISNDPNDETWIRIYNAVDEHPKFEELVTLIRDIGYVPYLGATPEEEEYFDLSFGIALDLVGEFFDENGNPKPQPQTQQHSNAIETQAVVEYDGLDI